MGTIQHYRSTAAGNRPSSLAAGRLAFNHTDGMLSYSNAAGAVASRSLRDYAILLAKGDVANVASVDLSIDPAVIGIMRGFILRLNDAVPVSGSTYLMLRVGTSSGINSGSSDYRDIAFRAQSGFSYFYGASNAMGLSVSNTAMSDVEVLLNSNDPALVHFRRASFQSTFRDGSSICVGSGSSYRTADIDITQIRVLFSSGNISKMKYLLMGLP